MKSSVPLSRVVLITVLILIGVELLFFKPPRYLFLNVEFPMALPAIFVIPPPYSPQWLPVVDGLSMNGETVRALGLALVGISLGLLLSRRYIRGLSLMLSAFVLWSLKFLVEAHPGDHELIRPYILVALLLILGSLLTVRRLWRESEGFSLGFRVPG